MNPKYTYETTFIVNAALEDANIEPIINSTVEFIQNNGGTVATLDKWGRRRLAYPIQKKHNGYYVYVMYDAPPTLIPQLERYFQLEENVLRHLTLKMTGPGIEFRKQYLINRQERLVAEAAAAEAPAETTDAPETAAPATTSVPASVAPASAAAAPVSDAETETVQEEVAA